MDIALVANTTISALLEQANQLIKKKQFDEAFTLFDQALEIEPHSTLVRTSYCEAIAYRGHCLARLGNNNGVFELFERALQIEPCNIIALTHYAVALAYADQQNMAWQKFEQALQIDPDNVTTLGKYAKALSQARLFEEASKKYEQALQIDPGNETTLKDYGNNLVLYMKALVFVGEYVVAEGIFKRLLSVVSEDVNNRKKMASNCAVSATELSKLGDLEPSFWLFERALQLDPENIKTQADYGNALFSVGDFSKAHDFFRRALQFNPDDSKTQVKYVKGLAGRIYIMSLVQAGHYIAAEEIFIGLLNVVSDDSKGKKELASVCARNATALSKSGELEPSFWLFERALQLDPENIITLTNYGNALSSAGKYTKAVVVFNQALRFSPNDIITLNSYGNALSVAGDYSKATEVFDLALQLDPYNSKTLKNYGRMLFALGLYEQAADLLEQSLEIRRDNYILFICAQALEELGEYEQAISKLEMVDWGAISQYHADIIRIALGRLHYCINMKERGDAYFEEALVHSEDKERTLLYSARSILAHSPHSETAIGMLKQIGKESFRYTQAYEMLTLNLGSKDYFDMVTVAAGSGIQDTEMLHRAIYHKIANEISILKLIVYRIIRSSGNSDQALDDIIANIELILTGIDERRAKHKAIPDDDYEHIIASISETAHDISDFVNNELAVIESQVRRLIKNQPADSARQQQFAQLLEQLELTQDALNDLKSINEGITIKYSRFKVAHLFEKWRKNPRINNATITLAIHNSDSEFIGDEEKIKSALNELVENSLRHNPDMPNLEIYIQSQDVINPFGIRGRNIPGEQRYLRIEFCDNGKGVPPDKKDWIFQPLKTTVQDKGSGLGLFIIRRTLQKMRGYIRETGVDGARFEMYIPYAGE